jgi:hypothetical protein
MIFLTTKKGRTTSFFPSSFVADVSYGIRDEYTAKGHKNVRIRDKHPGSSTPFSVLQGY